LPLRATHAPHLHAALPIFERVKLLHPFVLRSVEPPLGTANGRKVTGVRRVGKRIVLALEGDLFLVIHLMIAGRLHWKAPGARGAGKQGLAAFELESGTLVLTEAGTKRRAAIHLVQGEWALGEHDAGGIDVFAADPAAFRAALENEKQTRQLDEAEWMRLYDATRAVLTEWVERLRQEAGEDFPEGVTAFRPDMAVHGRYGKPCPVCGAPVQRIVYAENETNYCPRCQTGGKLLADRSLSRLLHDDWTRTLEELVERRRQYSSRCSSPMDSL